MEYESQVVQGRTTASQTLVDRLDPALGEASAGIGVMLTELIRRTLRGGIQRVDEELAGVVNEKVDDAVASRMPAIESATERLAERTATDVATREVSALDRRTTEMEQRLAADIVESGRRLETAARGFVTEAEQRTGELVHRQVTELEQRAGERLTAEVSSLEERTGQRLAGEIESLEQRTTVATRELVTREIDGVEHRSEHKARSLLEEEVAALREKSRTATQTLNKHINALHEAHTELRQELSREQAQRSESLANFEAELTARTASLQSRMQAELERITAEFQRLHVQSQREKSELESRIAELERPRGIRAFAARMFGRKKTDQIPSVVDSILKEDHSSRDESAVHRE